MSNYCGSPRSVDSNLIEIDYSARSLRLGDHQIPCDSVLYAKSAEAGRVRIAYVKKNVKIFEGFAEGVTALEIDAFCTNKISSDDQSDKLGKVAVIVNPKAGKGKGVAKWENQIQPILQESGKFSFAGILITSRAGEAEEFAASPATEAIDGIITIGGDGLLSEVVNGLHAAGRLSSVALYPLPCGSGNGLVYSILAQKREPLTLPYALKALIRGNQQALDIFQFQTEVSPPRVAFLSVTFGLVADTDIESEWFRFLGGLRFTVCGLYGILRMRTYEASVSYEEYSAKADELRPSKTERTGSFTSISLFNVSHANADFIVAPERCANDRKLSLLCLTPQDGGRFGLIGAMLAAEKGHQIERYKWWRPVEVTSFQISTKGGTMGAGFVVDGEQVPGSQLTGALLSQTATTYSP